MEPLRSLAPSLPTVNMDTSQLGRRYTAVACTGGKIMDAPRTTQQEPDVRELLAEVSTLRTKVAALEASQGRRAHAQHVFFGRTTLGLFGRAGLAASLLALALGTNA